MRVCRFQYKSKIDFGFYTDDAVIPIQVVASNAGVESPKISSLLDLLPGGEHFSFAEELESKLSPEIVSDLGIAHSALKLLVPIPNPSKLLLLAGNYAKHIEEGGGKSEEREKTFPYVFMKPPSTTLTNPGDPIKIPACSPDQIDWELELGVVIGKRCSKVSEADALEYVAGYTVVNDISDRAFHPNPYRAERPKDVFFDWLHGKWHDTFCPMGPCILSASEVVDPQNLKLQLTLNGEIEQDSSTAEMVFPVAAIIEFISSYVTLEPGDIISTGTPSGVGKAKGKFLRVGDTVAATIGGIGCLVNPIAR
ncbi:MAG: fumarylacetoacetate hydrolase family protein [Planctomicrobium sp.]|jgi:2,4-didehydro-3-deoxy-L-rhamnonate hydrolase|nr:fumarylacetoacetate hydrolase family protein [Planctomicrobium sp.]